MAANDPIMPPPAGSQAPRKSSFMRYAVSLALIVVVIGGIAWVAQFLPRWTQTRTVTPRGNTGAKTLLEFARTMAQWSEKPPEPDSKEVAWREVEPGQKGYYDFPFKNIAGEAVEINYYTSSCDCASVQVCALDAAEWERVSKAQADKPAEPLVFAAEPVWQDLVKEPEWSKLGSDVQKQKRLTVASDQGGLVRVRWVAKSAGQEMKVMPVVWHQRAGDTRPNGQPLGVPLAVSMPVRFYPPRIHVGGLSLGAKATGEFHAWSSTRSDLDLKLTPNPADSLCDVVIKPLSKQECADLETSLRGDVVLTAGKAPPRVLVAHHVQVTMHESRDGKQLDLGSFYRKLDVTLDNIPQRDVPGPEIVGRVHGGIVIGGSDDQGRVRFRTFNAREGAVKTVEISTDVKAQLETFKHDPSWIHVKLTRAAKQEDPKRTIWLLQVEVPSDTPAAHSFEEPNAVILRIVGPPERFVRIPIEGHLIDR